MPSKKTTSNNKIGSANPLLYCFIGVSRLVYAPSIAHISGVFIDVSDYANRYIKIYF